MTAVLQGIRIVEVAEQTFVPAAAGLLADWGAEVVKIEHVERGDAMRGLASTGVVDIPSDANVLMEHSNRGKQSLGLDLASPEGLDILYKLAARSDVFLNNKLPRVRKKLKIEVDDIRAQNPRIIYATGTGQGQRGPDADKGAYDSLAFWNRSGIAMAIKPADAEDVPAQAAPGFGDSIGAMAIAGGIMGALLHRERTGEALTVDVSLFGVGMWAMGQAISLSLLVNRPWVQSGARITNNPLVGNYKTKDGRFLAFTCLQAGHYWPSFTEFIGRPELATDPRFADHVSLLANDEEAVEILTEVFASATVAEWRERLADFTGQWVVVQDTLEAAVDPQTLANGYVHDCETASGTPFQLVAAPVQFDGEVSIPRRGPEFNEQGDAILEGLGYDWDTIVDLKVRGIVA